MAVHDVLRLDVKARLPEGIAGPRLRSLPCGVCGSAGGVPAVLALGTGMLVAFCSIEHAQQRGWPWLRQTVPGGSRVRKE